MAGPDEAPVFSYTELLGLVDDPYAATDFRRLTGDGVAPAGGVGSKAAGAKARVPPAEPPSPVDVRLALELENYYPLR